MRTFLFTIVALLMASCTDAGWSNVTSLGTPGHVVCYSGGQKIYEGDSTGKVMNHLHSNGFYFRAKDGLFYDIQADCVITHP